MAITTSENDIKERLSTAYVTAVAARAGCQVVSWAIDKTSVDATIRPVSGSRACIDLQVKATSTKVVFGSFVKFDLPIKNYNDLRETAQTNPHYLVVLRLPGKMEGWLRLSPQQLAIRGIAFWSNLALLPAVPNSTSIRVSFEATQRFTHESLANMIEHAPARIGGPGSL